MQLQPIECVKEAYKRALREGLKRGPVMDSQEKLINWQNHMIFQKESEIVELVKTNIPEDKISAEQVLQSKVAN